MRHHNGLLARVHAWRRFLEHTPGQNFALCCNDSLEFACALFGAWYAGKTIFLPTDILDATCSALGDVVDGYLGEFAPQWSPRVPPDTNEGDGGHYDVTMDVRQLPSDHLGLVVYTSGSTGAPQAIPKRLGQLAAEVATLEDLFGARLGDGKVIATVSHQHIYGLLFKVLWPLATGRAMHARQCMYPEELAAACAAHASVIISSPAHLKRLTDSIFVKTLPQHTVRAVFSSGGPLARDVALQWADLLGQAPIEVYGSSETGGIAWRQRQAHTQGEADAAWTPLPGVRWRVDAAQGVLMVQSAHVGALLHNYGNRICDGIGDFERDGDGIWLRTADRIISGDNNTFVLCGRLDRLVKIEEKRVSLTAIERALCASDLVADARVLVRERSQHGPQQRQHVVACVVLSAPGRDILKHRGKFTLNGMLRDALVASVERVALPRGWRYVDALPVNSQGKTTQVELLRLLDSDEPTHGMHAALTPQKQGSAISQRGIVMPDYRILEHDDLRVVFELRAPANLLYFEGHFADAPILAGVVQVDWAIHFARQCFVLPPRFLGVQGLKFQQVILPEKPFTMELLHDPIKSSLTFRMTSAAGQHASGRILFGDADV